MKASVIIDKSPIYIMFFLILGGLASIIASFIVQIKYMQEINDDPTMEEDIGKKNAGYIAIGIVSAIIIVYTLFVVFFSNKKDFESASLLAGEVKARDPTRSYPGTYAKSLFTIPPLESRNRELFEMNRQTRRQARAEEAMYSIEPGATNPGYDVQMDLQDPGYGVY